MLRGVRLMHYLGGAGLLAAGLACGLISASAVERTPKRKLAEAAPVLRVGDEGPKFFTIRQVLERRSGAAPAGGSAFSSGDLGLRLSHGGADSGAPPASSEHPFAGAGYQMFPSINGSVAARWQSVLSAWPKERAEIEKCAVDRSRCSRAAGTFLGIVTEGRALEGVARIRHVNARVNASVTYQTDWVHHNHPDVWMAPLKTLGGAGDCEDYAIAKYFALRFLGAADDDLRIVLLKDRKAREDHAVLAVRLGAGWLLLDNRFDRIEGDADAPHYRPYFALNASKRDMFAAPFVESDLFDGDIEFQLRGTLTLADVRELGLPALR